MSTVSSIQSNSWAKREAQYFCVNRPWLNLYGTRVRAVSPPDSGTSKVHDTSLINRTLPDELMHEVFVRMTPVTLGRSACVCRRWRYAVRSPSLWRNICLQAWKVHGEEANEDFVWTNYAGSWRNMWRLRPRLRTEGIYVSRNTYIRVGIVEWKTKNPVHMVCYFRYMRFLPSGKFYYKVTPLFVRDVARSMIHKPSKSDRVLTGRYNLNGDQIEAALLYPGSTPTVLHIRAKVRGTCEGANNRLDLISLVTCGIDEQFPDANQQDNDDGDNHENVIHTIESWHDNESSISHKRGMAPFVFVPFEEAETDILNLPIDKMDYYCPG